MPMYNVEHSYPLKVQQKEDLAYRITKLHGEAFATLSIFVQVKFIQQDATTANHFVGGLPSDQASNRITAFVRTSPARSQEDFNKLAKKVEDAWYIVLGEKAENEEDEEKLQKAKKEQSAVETAAKELLSIAYIGGLSGREKGFEIPVAGKEQEWFKTNREEFEKKAELGDEGFKGLLEEVKNRDDLKSWAN